MTSPLRLNQRGASCRWQILLSEQLLQFSRPSPFLGVGLIRHAELNALRIGEGQRLRYVQDATDIQKDWPLAVRRVQVPQIKADRVGLENARVERNSRHLLHP